MRDMRLCAADAALDSAAAAGDSRVRERDLQLAKQTRADLCSTDHRTGARMARSTHDD